MGYKVDYDALFSFTSAISSQANAWNEILGQVQAAAQTLIGTQKMSGMAADNIRSYLQAVHGTILSSLCQIVSLHQENSLLYWDAYQKEIDGSPHAVIEKEELLNIAEELGKSRQGAVQINDSAENALRGIRDLVYVGFRDVGSVDEAHKRAVRLIRDTDEKIEALEEKHLNNDFSATTQMFESLKAFLSDQLSKGREYKENFSADALTGTPESAALYDAYMAVNRQRQEHAPALQKAVENVNEHVEILQEEYEQRQKEAQIINWIVTGVCIVASVAVTMATAGAAAPLVMAGITGAFMSGTRSITSQYVENGDWGMTDWGAVAGEAVVGGVTGVATAYVGGQIGNAVTGIIGKTGVGTMLNSSSGLTRIGGNAIVGSVSEVASGVGSRGIGSFLTNGGNLGEAVVDAINPEEIMKDAVVGGVGGTIQGVTSVKQAQTAADKTAFDYNTKRDPVGTGEKHGFENLKRTKNGGVDFSESDYIMRTDDGQPVQVKIKSTGDRRKDYLEAEKILKEQGIDTDFKSLRTGKTKEYVWHHVDDYNAWTNETTLQFVEVEAHQGVGQHTGSAKQYYQANGRGYSKDGAVPQYDGVDISEELSSSVGLVSEQVEYSSRAGSANHAIPNPFGKMAAAVPAT